MKAKSSLNGSTGKSDVQVDLPTVQVDRLTDGQIRDAFHFSVPWGTSHVSIEAPRPSPEAVARAEALLSHARKATGQDRFPAVVAVALLYRCNGLSELDARGVLENLSQDICEPALAVSKLDEAVYLAFFEPELADWVVAGGEQAEALALSPSDPAPGELAGGTVPASVGAELAAQPSDDRSPLASIVSAGADPSADRDTPPLDPDTARWGSSTAVVPSAVENARREAVGKASSHARPMSAKERMAKRRAELKRLGLPAKWKGSLRGVTLASVTPPGVTPPAAPA